MPLIRIDLIEGRSSAQVDAIGAAVHRAQVETLGVPERDRFQVISEHKPGRLVYNPEYLEVLRSDGIVLIQVYLSAGRSAEMKQAFYARAAELLAAAGVRPEDVTICLVENQRGDWSFGKGMAQYLVLPKEQWR
jgi:4-oxalocrotonate tautomerase